MDKKAELSLSIIVMAVVALLILIILSFITLRGTGNFSEGVTSCGGNGECVESTAACDIGVRFDVAVPTSCKDDQGTPGKYCCRKIGG